MNFNSFWKLTFSNSPMLIFLVTLRFFAVGDHYDVVKKKNSLFIFIDRGKAFFGLWEQNNVFRSACESVVGALMLGSI